MERWIGIYENALYSTVFNSRIRCSVRIFCPQPLFLFSVKCMQWNHVQILWLYLCKVEKHKCLRGRGKNWKDGKNALIPYKWHCPVTVKGARYSGCDVSFGKREKLLATGNRQVGWSSSGRTTSLILHLFHDITLHFSQTNSRKDISFKYKNKMGNYGSALFWVTNKSFKQILLAQCYQYWDSPFSSCWKF